MRKMDLNNIRVVRSETPRDINRRVVLNLIRIRAKAEAVCPDLSAGHSLNREGAGLTKIGSVKL